MSVPTVTKTWILSSKPSGAIQSDTFKLEEKPIPELKDGEVLLKTIAFSNDPAQRTWIQKGATKERAYAACPDEGDPMSSALMGEVVATKATKWKEGDKAVALASWSEYVIVDANGLQPAVQIEGQSESISLSSLGLVAMTAWCGLTQVGKLTKENAADSVVVISGAAGATGSAAVQIAKKILGCKTVIGIAGGAEKCNWVKQLGADECLDYKKSTFAADLIKVTPNFVSHYFDNIGGEILNQMFPRMGRFSRIIACGAISSYNSRENNLSNFFEIVAMRITIQGFIVTDFLSVWGEATEQLTKAIKEGKFSTEGAETKVPASFEEVPQVWQRLFVGGNQGKLITQLK
ncbi:hypothetical protein JCM5296_000105 [Sporobolomyces johnsonii]